jgi:hypothetical protein
MLCASMQRRSIRYSVRFIHALWACNFRSSCLAFSACNAVSAYGRCLQQAQQLSTYSWHRCKASTELTKRSSSKVLDYSALQSDLPELPVHLLQVALRSPEAMELLGASLGQDAEPGDVVLLMG